MENYIDIALRIFVSFILGGAIGLERDYRSKDAGFRTHFLVAVGATLFTVISIYGFSSPFDRLDTSRVAAQVVSGIGFLGAGLIILQKNTIRGLTTAAGLWVTAAIGMACGVGMFAVAISVTILILLGLEVVNTFMPRWSKTRLHVGFTATSRDAVNQVLNELRKREVKFLSYELSDRRTSQGEIFEVVFELRVRSNMGNEFLLDLLKDFDEVRITEPE